MGEDPSEIGDQIIGDQMREGLQNPLGLALGACAVGFLVGLAMPVTSIEEQALPRVREKLGEQIRAVDLMDRAGQVLDETKRAAAHAVDAQVREVSEGTQWRTS